MRASSVDQAILDALSREPKAEPAKATVPSSLKMMDFKKMLELLNCYGIKLEGTFIGNKNEAWKEMERYDRPAVLKIVSSDVVHKTEKGGVVLGIKDEKELYSAWDQIVNNIRGEKFAPEMDGMVIQPMASGKELIIGMKRDPNFGSVIVFGLGGIFVEAMKYTSIRVGRISEDEA